MVVFVRTYGLRILLTLIVVYLLFFMSLGTRTFAGHVWRIARTPEARELYSELAGTVSSATSAVTRRLRAAAGGGGSASHSSSYY